MAEKEGRAAGVPVFGKAWQRQTSVDTTIQEWKEDVISEAISCLKNTLSLTSSREQLKGQILDIQDCLMRTGLIIVGMEPKLKQWACVSMAPVSPRLAAINSAELA